MSCIIKNCNSTYKNTTLFGIPVNEDARTKWIKAIEHHQPFDDSGTGVQLVCVNHFQDNEILPGIRKRISPSAVPSIFPAKAEIAPVKTGQHIRPNILKRTIPSIGPAPKVRKLDQSPQKNVPNGPIENSLVGKKVRLNIGSLRTMASFVGVTKVPNASTSLAAPVQLPARISNGQLSPFGKKIRIIVPKKSVHSIPKVSPGVQDSEKFNPLQPIADETSPEDNIFEQPSSSEPIGQRLKLVDIDKLKETPISSEAENKSNVLYTTNCSNEVCLNKLYLANGRVTILEKTITKLRLHNAVLKRELAKKSNTSAGNASAAAKTPTKMNQQSIMKTCFFKCAKCAASFEKPLELNKHIHHVHVRLEDNKCYNCGKRFVGTAQLEAHIHKVHRDIFECKVCHPMLKYLQEYHIAHETHAKTVDAAAKPPQALNNCPEIPRFECYICKDEINSITALQTHMEQHEKNQKCQICKASLTLIELNNTHLCGTEKSITCEYCEESFTSTMKLLEHLKTPHEKKKLYGCHKCSKYFPQLNLRHYHMFLHENEEGKDDDGSLRRYTCKVCDKGFDNYDHFYKHRKSHSSPTKKTRDHLCEECGMSFMTVQTLRAHKMSSIHSKEPTFQCSDCPRKFYNKIHLHRHAQKHENIKYVCDICNRELRSNMSYKKHMRRHNRTEADRRHECQICHMKFYEPKALTKHKLVHNGHRAHSCQYCDCSYKYKGDLNKHLRIHLDGKIHQCTMCDESFYYPEDLQEHIYDHYKKDKANRAAEGTAEGNAEADSKEEKNDEKEKDDEENNDCVSNNILVSSVSLKPSFIHENVQLWN
ncbi:zinc finger protein 91-like isoform X2 [Sitodiplosis mosellana]|uniref:zinc finger protein 91-like isoform X2 n=1 Tax=Sitodiplosis mosellana TaxID=263140 RepID=UPI0024451588|nr:zinc finger protein 91-like isoform X2 [Sitodiplosis mosellana]